jgi:general secretion pathway protein H
MTLIEIMVAIMVVGLVMSAATVGIGALTGSKARGAAGELAGTMRALYDMAAVTGKTCRLVFDLTGRGDGEEDAAPVRYRAECAAAGVTTGRDRDTALREETREVEERARRPQDEAPERDARVFVGAAQGGGPSLEELMTAEQTRVEEAATYQGFSSDSVTDRALPAGVRVEVWTRQQREYVDSGVAYLYFFPQGFTEKAQVRLTQGDNTWTLKVQPLTGKVNIVAEALEVPRS